MNSVNEEVIMNDIPVMHEVVTMGTDLEAAWLWFAGEVDSAKARRYCLEQALRVNPDSTIARQGLAVLTQQEPAPGPRRPVFSIRLGQLFGRRAAAEVVTTLR